jgi:hypothetical protein
MLCHLILIMAMAGPVKAGSAGQVSAANGTLTLRRAGLTYVAKPGADLLAGDVLETVDGGGAAFLLDDEHVVALGSTTLIVLQGTPGNRLISVQKGEIRATAGKASALTIGAGEAVATIRHGILRGAADGPRFRTERGAALLRISDRPPARLDAGREATASTSGRPVLVSSGANGWTIRSADLALADPKSDSRLLLAMQAPATTGDALKPSTLPTPTPTVPGTASPSTTTPPGNPIRRPDLPKPGNPNANPPGPEIPPAPDDTDATRSGPVPPAPADDASRSINNQAGDAENPDNPANRPYQPIAVSQPASLSTVSLALGNISASSSAASSGALFSDAQQDSVNLMFPGNVHVVANQSLYQLRDVQLKARDMFPVASQYWSIGIGPSPVTQVSTNLRTGSNLNPDVVRVPHTNAYLINLAQYGIKDPASTNNTNPSVDAIGISGFLGQNPTTPQIHGATPLLDTRAVFNQRLTFVVGELALSSATSKNGKGLNPVLAIRRSDQDRQIIKSPTGNDNLDKVTPNPQVNFIQVHDPKFFPSVPLVYVPAVPPTPSLSGAPTYRNLDLLRKAAATTLLADSLGNYSQRTGQTRFVVDGKIVDITGYHRAGNSLMRSGHAAPGMAGGPVKAVYHQAAGSHRRGK